MGPSDDPCPRCLADTPTDVECPTCRAGHHHECWIAGGGCANGRCPSRVERDDTPPLGLPIPDEDPDAPVVIERGRGWRWAARGAGVLALLLAALFAWQALAGDTTAVPVVTVPQVTDFQWQEAREILAEQGFEVRWDSEVVDEGVHEAVIRQLPEAGQAVPTASTVYITYAVVPQPTTTPTPGPASTVSGEVATAVPTDVDGTPSPTPSPSPSAQAGPPLDPPWIAIVATPADEAIARSLYEGRYAADHPDGGVLATADYPDMADGFWVVYLDTFTTRAEAEAFCTERYGTPPQGRDPACYVRTTDGVR